MAAYFVRAEGHTRQFTGNKKVPGNFQNKQGF